MKKNCASSWLFTKNFLVNCKEVYSETWKRVNKMLNYRPSRVSIFGEAIEVQEWWYVLSLMICAFFDEQRSVTVYSGCVSCEENDWEWLSWLLHQYAATCWTIHVDHKSEHPNHTSSCATQVLLLGPSPDSKTWNKNRLFFDFVGLTPVIYQVTA